jgi:hypothetical protein
MDIISTQIVNRPYYFDILPLPKPAMTVANEALLTPGGMRAFIINPLHLPEGEGLQSLFILYKSSAKRHFFVQL